MNTITHDIFVTVMPSKNFCKQMQRQARSTKMFKLIAVGAMALAAATEVERRKLEERVYCCFIRYEAGRIIAFRSQTGLRLVWHLRFPLIPFLILPAAEQTILYDAVW